MFPVVVRVVQNNNLDNNCVGQQTNTTVPCGSICGFVFLYNSQSYCIFASKLFCFYHDCSFFVLSLVFLFVSLNSLPSALVSLPSFFDSCLSHCDATRKSPSNEDLVLTKSRNREKTESSFQML